MLSLVLLPGLDGTGLLFEPLARCLPKSISPVVVSYPSDLALGYEQLLPLIQERLPAAPFVLLGESFSGPLAIMAAALRPPSLRAVVLCASFVRTPVAYLPAWCSRLVRPFMFRLYPAVARLRLLLGPFSDPAVRALAVRAVAEVRPDVLAHRIGAVHEVDVSDQLRACPVPVLYLRGSRDRIVPERAMRACLQVNPKIHVATLAAPHMVLQAQPAASAGAIQDFIEATCAV